MLNITLKDGKVIETPENSTIYDIAKAINEGLARSATAGEVDGELVDLRYVVTHDCHINILTFADDKGKIAFRHTASHVLAQAIKRLYKDAKLAIGPAVDDGFYYDIDTDIRITEDDFPAIEQEMRKIVSEDLKIERFTLSRADALALMEEQQEPYKVMLINDLPQDEEISFYKQGEFTDLCAGPHLLSTKSLKALKLTSVAGAYWRGDENNKMLTRIYGTAFPKKTDLDAYLHMLAEAKKRDHRKIGKEMKLFFFNEAGPGFPFFLPNGLVLKNEIIKYWKEKHVAAGYQEIATPIILSRSLWETSGHWDHYRENMYTTEIDGEAYAIKPMNCPGGMLVYKSEPHSYRDLPLRLAELGLVHRHEKSGTMHGLMRVRSFTQDDAHIFMTPEQITDEIKNVVRLLDDIYKTFNFTYTVMLSTRPKDFMGKISEWDYAEKSLARALDELDLSYKINEGDGAFYGPKIDFKIRDCIGRSWQCGTIQLDFQLPQRFEAEYIGADGERHRPIMIHRALLGSIERFIGELTEHCAGKFPLWLMPEQVRILPISTEKHGAYALELKTKLQEAGMRVTIDERSETMGYKVRDAQMAKVGYMLIVGDKEVQDGTVSVRKRDQEQNKSMTLTAFLQEITPLIKERVWNS